MQKKQLNKILNKPLAPRDLELQILQNLEQQIAKESVNRQQRRWLRHLAVAASLVMTLILSGQYWQTPTIISAAYADISKDSHLQNGFANSQSQWLGQKGINRPPQTMTVEMSKYCNLSNNPTTHLRVAGQKQGKVNVFFHAGEKPYLWGKKEGMINDLHWKLLQVRENLTVIVLYTQDMKISGVQKLLGTMLPGAETRII